MATAAADIVEESGWNADEIDRLCGFLTLGMPLRRIALVLGRTQAAVAAKAHQIGRAPSYFR